MDQDSRRGSQRSAPSRDGRPRHQLEDKSPPGVPNPLPRRSAQGHLEPQLRHPGGSGTGTPFTAFAASDDAAKPAADEEAGESESDSDSGLAGGSADAAPTSRADDFRKGARRDHRSAKPAK